MSPDFQHEVFLEGEEGLGECELRIRSLTDGKILFSADASGLGTFRTATEPGNFKCLWSPDSRFVAIFTRGTKRSGETALYRIAGDQVQPIAIPDVMPRIRRHLTAELRALWIRPEVWLPGHGLLLSVEGTQMDEAHANFRFILTLNLKAGKSGRWTAAAAAFEQDHTIPFSIK